jgi:Potassium-transporting ATPase A subunit
MGTADDGQPKQQIIVTGPVAATVPMEQLGTNGGGFFGMNFAHPYQSPTALTNFVACFCDDGVPVLTRADVWPNVEPNMTFTRDFCGNAAAFYRDHRLEHLF